LEDLSPLESRNRTIPRRRGRPPLPRRSVGLPRNPVSSGNIQESPPSLAIPHRGLPKRSVGRPRKHSPNRQLQSFDRSAPVLSGNVQESLFPSEDISIMQNDGGGDEILSEMQGTLV